MEWKTALQKYGFTALVLMILAGTVALDNIELTYRCTSTGEEFDAVGLSETNKTAVNQYGIKKVCRNGVWKETTSSEPEVIKVRANNKEWICDTDDGRVNSYTRCLSGPFTAYLGELV